MIIGIPCESFEGERRVALTPDAVAMVAKSGFTVHIEAGAGTGAGCPDEV
jgi:NAD/NADP transhydrogenase alpha subunit